MKKYQTALMVLKKLKITVAFERKQKNAEPLMSLLLL